MAENTGIQWCDHTLNPWSGCTKVSAGCANCYAEVNYSVKMRGVKWGPNGNRIVASEAMWKEPVKWNKEAGRYMILDHKTPRGRVQYRPRVFCASLADVFEDWQGPMLDRHMMPIIRPDGDPLTMADCRTRLFRLVDDTPNLDWLILTKRPENVERMLPPYFPGGYVAEAGRMNQEGPRPNLWLGTSVENQAAADERIPHLLRTPAAVRFLSCEPLLEQVYLRKAVSAFASGPIAEWNGCEARMTGLHWVIVGGESGPGARACNVAWIRSIVEQCKTAGVPVFAKQLGVPRLLFDGPEWKLIDWPRGTSYDTAPDGLTLRLADKKGGDMEEWPEDLRVREFPKAAVQ